MRHTTAVKAPSKNRMLIADRIVILSGIECVVLRADVYDRIRYVVSDDVVSHDELRAMLARSAEGSDWLDPSMDIYDDY